MEWKRKDTAKAILSRPWRWVLIAIAVIGFYDLVIAQFVPNPFVFPRVIEIPTRLGLSWQTWAVIILFVLLIMVFEGAHHQIRTQLKPKPVLLPNRKELINAIHQLKEAARETIWRYDIAKSKSEIEDADGYTEALISYQLAYDKFDEAEKRLECEKDIAGEMFKKPITLFENTMKFYVLSREIPSMPSYSEILIQLVGTVKEVIRAIDAISQ